jgi:hypothetical protein
LGREGLEHGRTDNNILASNVDDIIKRDTYTQVVKLRADLDALKAGTDEKTKSLFSLWNTKILKD